MATIKTRDGRDLHYETSGPVRPGAPVLVFHHGQPGAALIHSDLADAAAAHDLVVVMASRPGYAGSDRHAGRRVSDVADDIENALDHLGAGRFVTAGWSGGGPHALACGALLAPRCAAVAAIAGVAPYCGVDDLDWTAGMGPENQSEFEALISGDPELEGRIAELCDTLRTVSADALVAELGGLVSPPDRAALEAGYKHYAAEWFRLSAASGHYGYWDDDLAFVAPWGFDLATTAVPVQVWIAGDDLMVPPSHGEWLAAHIPGATPFRREAEGHISLYTEHVGEIVDRLVKAAGSI